MLAFTAILCIAVAAGAAGAINMWYDRDIDAVMRRTRNRPIPAGRIAPGDALGFGIVLAVASVLLMALATNVAAAAWLAVLDRCSTSSIYTMWLKRRTPQNIVIGGAAGAFPPIIGWVAVTGHLGVLPVLLFADRVLLDAAAFLGAVAVRRTPTTSAPACRCCPWSPAPAPRAGTSAGTPCSWRRSRLLPWALGYTGAIYGLTACVLGLGFVATAWRVLRDRQDAPGVSLTGDRPARQCFKYSLAYLFVLFAALAADRLLA